MQKARFNMRREMQEADLVAFGSLYNVNNSGYLRELNPVVLRMGDTTAFDIGRNGTRIFAVEGVVDMVSDISHCVSVGPLYRREEVLCQHCDMFDLVRELNNIAKYYSFEKARTQKPEIPNFATQVHMYGIMKLVRTYGGTLDVQHVK